MDENCKLHEEMISLKIKGVETHVKALIELHDQATKFQNEKLEMILEQTLKTNGRVTNAEGELKKLTFWKWLIEKPHRIAIILVLIVMFSKMLTNEMIINFIIKLFA